MFAFFNTKEIKEVDVKQRGLISWKNPRIFARPTRLLTLSGLVRFF